jgi:hypothetical protein
VDVVMLSLAKHLLFLLKTNKSTDPSLALRMTSTAAFSSAC